VKETTEQCVSCGEETAVGTPLFAGRRRIERPGASAAFLCEPCDERLAASRGRRSLTEEEARRVVDGGSAVMITWTK
jgi:hypothetical protein